MPLRELESQAYFHLRPAPTEKAEVRETGLKEVKQIVRRHQKSSNAAALVDVFVCEEVCAYITLTP